MGASRPRWRRVVVGLVAGSGAPQVRVGIEGNPCRHGRLRHGGACGCHLTFREGVRGYPSSRHDVYRGKPLAAATSSSRTFLEVLIGAAASESWSLVEDPGGRCDREASSFLLIRHCRHLFSFVLSLSFFLGVTVLLPPQHIFMYGLVGCFVYKAGKPFFGIPE